jgi:hypothetical protein
MVLASGTWPPDGKTIATRKSMSVNSLLGEISLFGLTAFRQDHLPTVKPIQFNRYRYDHGLAVPSYGSYHSF